MRVRVLGLLSFAFLLAVGSASAQDSPRWNVGAAVVGVQYDLSGVGNAPGVAVRASRDVTRTLVLETRGLLAWPEQQSGRSTFFVPEAQLQYRWHVARFSPYIGAGGGVAMVKSPFRTEWDPTFSVSAGTDVSLTERVGLIGELRLRGIERRFTGSTAEGSLGMAWRLPSF